MRNWPFAGRRRELESISRLAQDRAARGVVIAGPAGVGKTRLAAEVLTRFPADRVTVLAVRATKAGSGIPNGALADLLPSHTPPGVANTLRWTADELLALGGGRLVLLDVDDVHLLDSHSALVVNSLVRSGRARLIATLRSGEPAPDSIEALWKDGHVHRDDLRPLTERDVREILAAALNGQPDDAAVQHLSAVSDGNALFLSEIVTSALACGALRPEHGMWKLAALPPLAPRLVDLIHNASGRCRAISRPSWNTPRSPSR
ncbi:AAA family ATPase [Sinosporangium siamense]|uniref:Orc1-like AAA ATPase domain-containing protein n=1 Tax=Sinosporangium siamense TaxID=1367973 RepID=A0A919RHC7_9ACTN|nr:AAA family ATPase [Sinosporangium siamense]GII93868.1 hypothetical protein Ssi02_40990 [Sinosporangium siamense]